MSFVRVKHKESGVVLAERVELAKSIHTRVLGLMFRRDMGVIDGLLIQPCNSIHTCFMRFSIDVVFLSANGEIIKILRSIRPWRFSWMYLRAVKALELRAGTVPASVHEGSYLEVQNV